MPTLTPDDISLAKRRHHEHCSGKQLDDMLKQPWAKEVTFTLISPMYRCHYFTSERGICLERLVCLYSACLFDCTPSSGDFYIGCSLKGLVDLFIATALFHCIDGKDKFQVLERYVYQSINLRGQDFMDTEYLPEGLLGIRFVSDCPNGSILARIVFDTRYFTFSSEPLYETRDPTEEWVSAVLASQTQRSPLSQNY